MLCNNTNDLIVVIWMNKYGDTNSWVKEYEFSFQLTPDTINYLVFPLKVLANGDLLFISEERVFIYS